MRNSILSLWSFIYIILMFFVTISCCQSISLMYNWPSVWILSLGRMLNIASTLGIVPFKYYFVVIYCVADGESRHLSIGALSKIFPNKGGLFQSFHRKLEFLQLCRFLILIFFLHGAILSWVDLADGQVLTKPLDYSPSIDRTRGEKCNEKFMDQSKRSEISY